MASKADYDATVHLYTRPAYMDHNSLWQPSSQKPESKQFVMFKLNTRHTDEGVVKTKRPRYENIYSCTYFGLTPLNWLCPLKPKPMPIQFV